MWDFLHSVDCVSPQQWAPDTWRAAFGKRHADAPVFLGLFRAGRAGREWALVTSKHVTVTLQAIEGRASDQWERRLRAVAAALSTRLAGSEPAADHLPPTTTLAVQCDGSAASATLLESLTEQLQHSGAGITALSVSAPAVASAAVTQYLHRAATAFPNTTSLQLQGLGWQLPPPSAFSNVRHMSMVLPSKKPESMFQYFYPVIEQVPSSLSPYTTQLTSLTLGALPDSSMHVPWPTLFSPYTVTHTLTHLTVSAVLDDQLMQTLLAQAPALTHLTVREVAPGLGDYSSRLWGLVQLTFQARVDWGGSSRKSPPRLPACTTGALQVGGEQGIEVWFTSGQEVSMCVGLLLLLLVVLVCMSAARRGSMHMHAGAELPHALWSQPPLCTTTLLRVCRR